MERILSEIRLERQLQNNKWGEQNHDIIAWQAILMEEVGEAAKEAVDFHFENGLKLSKEKKDHEVIDFIQMQRLGRYRKELIQVAAVAIQMIECLDRNGK